YIHLAPKYIQIILWQACSKTSQYRNYYGNVTRLERPKVRKFPNATQFILLKISKESSHKIL
ncbi:hypothetical protein LT991_17400, partial [Leptospira interrogans serovar Canicola]|uniref:hypothetical protein n=1 Tax=Leptospira interrogans TaxID=173 RepID=UPI001F118ED8